MIGAALHLNKTVTLRKPARTEFGTGGLLYCEEHTLGR